MDNPMCLELTGSDVGMEQTVKISGEFIIPQEYNLFESNCDADIKGRIFCKEPGFFVFDGSLSAKLKCCCSRCLKQVDYHLEVDVSEKLSNNAYETCKEDNNEDIWMFSGKAIDFEPIILSNLLVNIPLSTLCDEDCKGLCTTCGCDLNSSECGCDNMNFDPRFESLRSLFQTSP